ncbi:putative E3 ubiquitin-protein ligase HERC1 [Panicum miliaceum]|uniref:E3 ubiquitin-protein ligase HERC1 n=1 Tax=Panicum miliaceum TaxID=4540 RepID=A0A3L6RYU7_PANMI|nr:putative E3 ubiquitin-protein ligase HERC1 [Panicum miliaceum]
MASEFLKNGPFDRDVEQAITGLKKGTHLLKYGRLGKPKFCPFKLSNDETLLIWYTGKVEKQLRLNQVSRIIPGQRTAIFQRYPRPDKEFQSFSLIYGHRSLDLDLQNVNAHEVTGFGNIFSDVYSLWEYLVVVTKQGEIYSWGEESGGRLGHGVDADVCHPKLIRALSGIIIESVACGEFHTYAVSFCGDLYTWGDGTHYSGVLSHGNDTAHWIPKKVYGPLEGLHISSVSCGQWHTAIVTSLGQLFTFGDGVFGALGHGDRLSTNIPRHVNSLKGMCVLHAACGAWHTAAIVEIVDFLDTAAATKLFTWGDGDRGQLGHVDREARFIPACVASLLEPSFCLVACGHDYTVALSTSGQVYTMGSNAFGQLGNPKTDGKFPTLVGGIISSSFIEEIACGSHHIAVLTSKAEVTWGRGANGRLGHGDSVDRNTPTLVEAKISNSRKSTRASLAPDSFKSYRVCDECYTKLSTVADGKNLRNSGLLEGNPHQLSREATDPDKSLRSRLSKLLTCDSFKPDGVGIFFHSYLKSSLPFPANIASFLWTKFTKSYPTRNKLSENLTEEVARLKSQVNELTHKSELLEDELAKANNQLREVRATADLENLKCKAANEIISVLTTQSRGPVAAGLSPGALLPFTGRGGDKVPGGHARAQPGLSASTSSRRTERHGTPGGRPRPGPRHGIPCNAKASSSQQAGKVVAARYHPREHRQASATGTRRSAVTVLKKAPPRHA